MPIFVAEGNNVKPYTPSEITVLLARNPLTFPGVRPANEARLIDQLLTRYDFGNRRFKSFDALRQQLVADALEEATDVGVERDGRVMGLDRAQWSRAPFQSQFKAIAIAKIGEMSFLSLQPKGGGQGMDKEASLLHMIEQLGLRAVPVYGASTDRQMFQRCIVGSFMDLYKQNLCSRATKCKMTILELCVFSAFLGETMPTGEAAVMKLPTFEVKLVERLRRETIAPSCISTALSDFTKIQNLMKIGHRVENDDGDIEYEQMYIADLQGVLESKTGKFFIIDPLALKKRSEAKEAEKHLIEMAEANLDAIVSFLEHLLFAPRPVQTKPQEIPKLSLPPKH